MEENYNKNEENSKLGAEEKDRSNQGTQNTPNNANNSNNNNYNNNSGGYYNNNYNNGYSNNNYNNNGYLNYNNGNNNYESQESKTVMGVLFALFLGAIGLLIGMCMYPQNSYERKTFVSGWVTTFVICIAVAAVFTIIAVVVVAGSAY